MKNTSLLAKFAILILSLCFTTAPAIAVDFSSSITTGAVLSDTKGTVSITGTSTSFVAASITNLSNSYDISISPCSGCSDAVSEYVVKGQYDVYSATSTEINIQQSIQNSTGGVFCEVDVTAGAFSAGMAISTTNSTSYTETLDTSVTTVQGSEVYTGTIYDVASSNRGNSNIVPVGHIVDESSYEQTIVKDILTATVEHSGTYTVSSYIGN